LQGHELDPLSTALSTTLIGIKMVVAYDMSTFGEPERNSCTECEWQLTSSTTHKLPEIEIRL